MGNKYIRALAIFLITAILIFGIYITLLECYSLIKLDNEITFSGSYVAIISSIPFFIYIALGSVYHSITKVLPKHNKKILHSLCVIALIAITVGPFVSFYVTFKLTHEGYVKCDRISWMSPNTFVKAPANCD